MARRKLLLTGRYTQISTSFASLHIWPFFTARKMSVIGILQQLSPAKSSSAGMDDQNVEFLLSNIPKQVRLFFRH